MTNRLLITVLSGPTLAVGCGSVKHILKVTIYLKYLHLALTVFGK